MQEAAAADGLRLVPYSADIADPAQCEALLARIADEHGGVDILVNNAGRSIRRSIELSYDRFHDFERLMAVNYFAALRLCLGVLPGMVQRRRGHVINISSIGVLTNAPRFSGYVASKAALEAWTRCAASEFLDQGVHFTTVNMPLVRTDMIAPTKLYQDAPTLSPEEAADLVVEAIIRRPDRIATPARPVRQDRGHRLAPAGAHHHEHGLPHVPGLRRGSRPARKGTRQRRRTRWLSRSCCMGYICDDKK